MFFFLEASFWGDMVKYNHVTSERNFGSGTVLSRDLGKVILL